MSEHRRSAEGVCQRCGHVPERDAPAEVCAPRVVYIPSKFRVQDYISPNGLTHYGQKTLAQVQVEEPDAVVMDAAEAYELHCAHFREPVSETTEERFNYALEVLPPCKWGHWSGVEMFHVSERITGNIVSWFFCVRWESCPNGARYFTLDDDATLKGEELARRVREFMDANPAPVATVEAVAS